MPGPGALIEPGPGDYRTRYHYGSRPNYGLSQ